MTAAAVAWCNHLLAKNGVCRCGWAAGGTPEELHEAPPAPAIEVDDIGPRAERCRRHLSWFLRESWNVLEESTALEWGWHIEAICDHVQHVLEEWMWAKKQPGYKQKVRNAYFSLPPGVLKTRIIMECAPVWMWLRWPSWTVTCLSVNPDRARDSARNARKIITSDWYQQWFTPEWTLRDDQDAVGDYGNTKGGHRKSRGIHAQIIGSRTDALFVDDPNDPEDDVDQYAKIKKLWDSTLFQRVNDLRHSVRIIVQQRVDMDDLTGHVKKMSGWMGFVLPLLYDPDRKCTTPYGWSDPREIPDEPLHPDRFTEEVIKQLREDVLGPTMFQAQAQQDPDKNDGEHFKMVWWNFWRRSDAPEPKKPRGPEFRTDAPLIVNVDRWGVLDAGDPCVTVDATGGSTEPDASHVGILVCVCKDHRRLVLDDLGRGPRGWEQMKTDLDIAIPHAANITGKRRVHLLIEKKALGTALAGEIVSRVKAGGYRNSAGESIAVTVDEYEPANTNASKIARAQAMEVPMALGEIYVPEEAPWLAKFFAEFKRFPKKPNDRVDALAQFLDRHRTKKTWRDAMKNA